MKKMQKLVLGVAMAGALLSGSVVFAKPVLRIPATQTISSAGTIADDTCGGVKRISAASAVTTNTTDTFTAPSAHNNGCCMDVVNVGSYAITLDSNAHNSLAANVVIITNGSVRVCSDGSKWYAVGAWTEF